MRRVSLAAWVLVSAVVGAPAAWGQFVIDHDQGGHRLRSLHGAAAPRIKRSFESDREAASIFREILSATGIPGVAERILVRATADTPNAEAQISEGNQRYIFYNAAFMQELRAKTGKYWSLVFVVAHEVGHHIAGHLDFQGQNHQVELEADRYAGFILARMGANYEEAIAAVRNIGAAEETTTHPPRDQRMQAVSLGWSDGRGSQRPPATGRDERQTASTAREHEATIPPRPRSAAESCAVYNRTEGNERYCVSSALAPQHGNSYGVQHLFDGQPGTAWVEGKSGDGTGEWIVVEFGSSRTVRAITVRNGYAKNADIYGKNGRVHELELLSSQGERRTVTLRDTSEPQTISLQPPIEAHWVQLIIRSVFAGSRYSDTAISELTIR